MEAKGKALQLKKQRPFVGGDSRTKRPPTQYHVDVLGKGLDILDTLRGASVDLRLTDVAERTGLDMSTAFRMLCTLETHGYVLRDKVTKKFSHCLGHRNYRVGYAQLSNDQPFVQKVTQGLVDAAARAQVELLLVDNKERPEQAIKNAEWLIAQKVDFVIEYEFHSGVGPALADMFRKADIPLLAIDIPMPSAIYFGVDKDVSLASIAVGHYDAYLRTYAHAVRTFRCRVVLSFGHEMNGSWYSWGRPQTSPATFIAAWRQHLSRVQGRARPQCDLVLGPRSRLAI